MASNYRHSRCIRFHEMPAQVERGGRHQITNEGKQKRPQQSAYWTDLFNPILITKLRDFLPVRFHLVD
jgi:hypothetical protein